MTRYQVCLAAPTCTVFETWGFTDGTQDNADVVFKICCSPLTLFSTMFQQMSRPIERRVSAETPIILTASAFWARTESVRQRI